MFSTNPEFDYDKNDAAEDVANQEQVLELHFEKKGRGGKQVVVIRGFRGTDETLNGLAKTLKQQCGVGGSVKDGEIILQGNVRDKATDYLKNEGFVTKRIGG